MFNIPTLILLGVYGIISVVHLVFCFLELELYRKITKPFCVLILSIAFLVAAPESYFIYVGLLFGFLGDLLLIWKRKLRCFILGTLAFVINHVCNFIQIFLYLGKTGVTVPWYFFMIMGLCVLSLVIGLYPFTKKLAGKAALLGNFYVPFLGCVAILSAWLLSELKITYPGIFLLFGYIIFLISDLILIYTTFKKDVKRRDFYIMATYLTAQFLISFSLVMIGILQPW